MRHLNNIPKRMEISIPPGEDRMTGRECPVPECLGYFKVEPGTGLKGADLPCHCPYCGYSESHNKFWTKEQIEYAKSVALNRVTGAIIKDLKALEFNHRSSGAFGIGISMRVEGQPHPIRYYREQELETTIICEYCTLRYAVYGVFAFCPDCGEHNSLQILGANLELAEKEIALAATVDQAMADYLTADALENAISAFDGFGREACRVRATVTTDPAKVEKLSFQNLAGARKNMQDLFGFDLAAGVAADEWDFSCRCFQKRHLLAHKMGIVDESYVKVTGDPDVIVGRKVPITGQEVTLLIGVLKRLGVHLVNQLP
jgi:hypothetical protein